MNSKYQKNDRSGQKRRSSNKKSQGFTGRKKENDNNRPQFDFDDPGFWDNMEKELDFEFNDSSDKSNKRESYSERNNEGKSGMSDRKPRKVETGDNSNGFVRWSNKEAKKENYSRSERSGNFKRSDDKKKRKPFLEKKDNYDRSSNDIKNIPYKEKSQRRSDHEKQNSFESDKSKDDRNTKYEKSIERRGNNSRFANRRNESFDDKRRFEKRDRFEKKHTSSDDQISFDYKTSRNKKNDRTDYSKPDFYEKKPYQDRENKEIRLNRFISNAGVCSRRDADDLILNGEIKVNGTVVSELGYKVKLNDKVEYRGKTLDPQKKVYLLLNKPKDTLTTFDDPEGRRTVYDIIKEATKERIYSVGRLDRNTTGLLLFTNNGDMATALTHPANNIKKLYHVVLNKEVSINDLEKLKNGIELEDGFIAADDISYANETTNEIGIEIHSGRNRIVRRMFESLEYEIVRLDRVMFAGLTKKNLPRGEWRMLTSNEITHLQMLVGSSDKFKNSNKISNVKRPRIDKKNKGDK